MTRVNLVKYGFVRSPEDDFRDDGNAFSGYRVGRIRVSKLVSDGEAYIDGRIDSGFLEYDEYKKLPHYSALGRLNGVSLASITEDDLQKFYEDCQAFEVEYVAEENRIKASLPTEEEIRERCFEILGLRHTELDEIDKRLATITPKLLVCANDWEWKYIRDHYKSLVNKITTYNVSEFPKSIVGKPSSRTFMSGRNGELKPTYYYERLMEIFDKYENM